MSTRDFPPPSGHITYDPDTLMRWLNLVGQALNIDDHVAVTSPSTSDEVDIFNVAAGKRRKVTLANLVALASVPANITCTSINFGQTSLSYYGTGTWTPIDSSGASLTFTTPTGRYTRVGNLVWASFNLTYPVTGSGSGAIIGGFPFVTQNNEASRGGGDIGYSTIGSQITLLMQANATTGLLLNNAGAQVTNAQMSNTQIYGGALYLTN